MILFIVGINIYVVKSSSSDIFENPQDVPTCDVAVVLGTSRILRGGLKNAYFMYRIEAAVALYKAGRVKKIIVSGDNSVKHYNETDDMREELEIRGVPSKDIVNDHAGFRTLDSVVRAKSVFGQTRIVVVSQRFHVQRALFIARAHDIEAFGYVAQDPVSSRSTAKVMAREYLARVKAFLDCYILGTEPRFPGPAEPIVMD
ncbi:UNVERIFIED_CONTAM: hypothetical protein GTU68_030990 [Idotea baltica]|nr:hypothetical protein [Idotea baltica]